MDPTDADRVAAQRAAAERQAHTERRDDRAAHRDAELVEPLAAEAKGLITKALHVLANRNFEGIREVSWKVPRARFLDRRGGLFGFKTVRGGAYVLHTFSYYPHGVDKPSTGEVLLMSDGRLKRAAHDLFPPVTLEQYVRNLYRPAPRNRRESIVFGNAWGWSVEPLRLLVADLRRIVES